MDRENPITFTVTMNVAVRVERGDGVEMYPERPDLGTWE